MQVEDSDRFWKAADWLATMRPEEKLPKSSEVVQTSLQKTKSLRKTTKFTNFDDRQLRVLRDRFATRTWI